MTNKYLPHQKPIKVGEFHLQIPPGKLHSINMPVGAGKYSDLGLFVNPATSIHGSVTGRFHADGADTPHIYDALNKTIAGEDYVTFTEYMVIDGKLEPIAYGSSWLKKPK